MTSTTISLSRCVDKSNHPRRWRTCTSLTTKSLQLFGQLTDTAQTDLRDKNLQAVLAWQQTLSPLSQRIDELRV